ncbi:ABC transporter substrate-binding protein [Actinomyces slackii]|uniref:Cyclodextrin-binding protein n=1 Tax=Actinomyces slackii TaxID=52774 RepID=A0A3S4TCD6_9ACTO|nr:sugar ABC transporter substrate-binding protein [Actinomyces slackii]VEG74631.1 Cyclodextrin-binding protein precursor [Actinomyces slackii]
MDAFISRRSLMISASALAVLGAGASLSACSSGSTSSNAKAPNQMFAWVSSESDRAQWQAFVDAVKKSHPDFTLEFSGPSYNDYYAKAKTRMTEKDAPGILTTQAARTKELVSVMEPLDDLIAKHGVDVSIYNPAMIEGMTVDGKIYALPYDAEPDVMFYNRRLFTEAGLSLPPTSYTYEQFLSDMKTLTTGGKYGIAIKPGFLDNAPGTFAYADGATVLDDAGKPALTSKVFVSSVQKAFDLAAKHSVAKAPSASDGDEVAQGAFTSGEAASIIDGPWMYSTFAEQLGEDLGVCVVPSDSGKAVGLIQGSGFGVAKNCPDKDAAFANILKLVDPTVVGEVARTRGTVPSVESQIDGWAEGKHAESVEAITFLLENGTPLITPENWNQITTSFSQYCPEGFRGSRTAADILKDLQEAAG